MRLLLATFLVLFAPTLGPSLDLIVVSTGNAFFVESPVNTKLTQVLLPALLKEPVAAD
jgi:hypothetical protein